MSKPDAYGDLVKKAKITEGMVKILTVENDYYFEVADSLMGRDLLIVNKVSGNTRSRTRDNWPSQTH